MIPLWWWPSPAVTEFMVSAAGAEQFCCERRKSAGPQVLPWLRIKLRSQKRSWGWRMPLKKFQEGNLLRNSPAGREVPLWNWSRSPRRCSFRNVEALCLHLLPQAIRSTSSCSGSPAAGPTSVPLFSFRWLWLCLRTAALNFPAMDPVILQLALGVTAPCLLISPLQV